RRGHSRHHGNQGRRRDLAATGTEALGGAGESGREARAGRFVREEGPRAWRQLGADARAKARDPVRDGRGRLPADRHVRAGGLSNPETSRRGNLYGMIGMAIAVLATVFGPRVTTGGLGWIAIALVAGGAIGLYLARTVKMTQMPELVAFMHSLVGLVAMLVGYASYFDPTASAGMSGAEVTIHHIEIYLGVLIGAVTLSGSVIAFGKLSGRL